MMIGINDFFDKGKKTKIGIILLILFGILMGFMLMIAGPMILIAIIADKFSGGVVKIGFKGVAAVACNSGSKWVGGIIGHVPIAGKPAKHAQDALCEISDLLNETGKLGLNDAIRQEFDCSTFQPSESPRPGENCSDSALGFTDGNSTAIPKNAQWLIPIYQHAQAKYHVPWELLGAINKIETTYGTNMSTSSAGAQGWMQFMPGTWATYGVDAGSVPDNGGCSPPTSKTPSFIPDGQKDTCDPVDAIHAAANYLGASGAKGIKDWNEWKSDCSDKLSRAVFSYNHACWYVTSVHSAYADIKRNETGGGIDAGLPSTSSCGVSGYVPSGAHYSDSKKVQVPSQTQYYVRTSSGGGMYARRDVLAANAAVAKFFEACVNKVKKSDFALNDFGYGNPRPPCGCHATHWTGGDQDVNVTGATNMDVIGVYSRANAKTLAALYFRAGATAILFDDPFVRAAFPPKGRVLGIIPVAGHRDHFHVAWNPSGAVGAGAPLPQPGIKVFLSAVGSANPLDQNSPDQVGDIKNPALGFGPSFGF